VENVGNLWEIHGKSIGNTKENGNVWKKWKCIWTWDIFLGHISGTSMRNLWNIWEHIWEIYGK
jgi:hypothetical protein